MGHSTYVGRIGALAFALGVGVFVGATPGVALAEDTDASVTASANEDSSGPADTGSDAPDVPGDAGVDDDIADIDDDDADVADDVEEVVEETVERDGSDYDIDTPITETVDDSDESQSVEDDTDGPDTSEVADDPAVEDGPAPEVIGPADGAAAETVPVVDNSLTTTGQTETPQSTSVTVSSLLSSLLTPAGGPAMPAESPAWWVLLAAARRELGLPASARLTGASTDALTSALLTPAQAAAITRLGEVLVGDGPTDVVATNTRAYVANSAGRSITVIDTLTGTVLKTISLSSSPTMLAVTPSGGRVYVTGAQAGRVWVISTTTNSVVASVRVGDTPTGLAMSPTGSSVYVVNSDDGTVSRISTLTNNIVNTVYGVAKGVSSIAVSPDGSMIYTTSNSTGDVSYFSPLSLFATTIAGVTPGSLGITFGADSSRVYVSDITGSVKIIDTASHTVADSIAVAAGVPFDIAVSGDGTTLFVARSDDGKLSVYDIATRTEVASIVANPYLIDGPPGIAVSPDGTQLYWTDATNDRVHVIALIAPNANPVAGTVIVNGPNASGAVTGSVVVTDPEGQALTFTVSTPGKGTVTVTQTGGTFAFTYTPTAAARHAAAAQDADATAKADTFTLTVSDGQRGVTSVPITVTLAPANAAPTGTVKSSVSWFSATVYGTVTAKDPDRDALTFTASATAKGGTVAIDDDGSFTYTPTAAARHAAANAGATDADKQDTFDVVISDGHGGFTTVAVTVTIKAGNAIPTASVRTTPSWFSAKVFGTVTAKDLDKDGLTFAASETEKGGVVEIDARGRFTYTPTDAARHAAAADDDDAQDTFDIFVHDGHGGVATVAVTVKIKPANSAPTRAAAADVFTSPNSGVTTGRIVAIDADGDPLTYETVSATRKGELVVNADGTFAYTPTAQARAAASKRFAPSWDTADSFRVSVEDGHGGTTTLTVRVSIAPLGHVNQNPAGATVIASAPNSASGKVGGKVSAADVERDALTFSGSGLTPKGSVIVDAAGGFVYTPTDPARVRAAASDATASDREDTFTVTVTDGYGGTLAVPVTVKIVGPSGAATAA